MISSYSVVDLLGAGLPPDALDELKGELDTYRRGPHRSGAPVRNPELVPIAITTTLAARFTARHWSHLPTLVSLGCALIAAGCINLAIQSHTDSTPFLGHPTGYLPLIVVLATYAVLLARTRHVPTRTFAAISVVLTGAAVVHILGSRPVVAADFVMGSALLGCAATMPAAWIPLVRTRRTGPITWAELPAVIHRMPVTRSAWLAFAGFALVTAASELAFVMSTLSALPVDIQLGLASNMCGLVLIWRGFASACHRPVPA